MPEHRPPDTLIDAASGLSVPAGAHVASATLRRSRNRRIFDRCPPRPNRLNEPYAPVAQLDRALPSEGKCKLFLMVEGVVKNE